MLVVSELVTHQHIRAFVLADFPHGHRHLDPFEVRAIINLQPQPDQRHDLGFLLDLAARCCFLRCSHKR
jgi:hypothetical protein